MQITTSHKLNIILSVIILFLLAFLTTLLFLAQQNSLTQYNLSYLLWKYNLREYEANITLPGMTHDTSYRDSLIGQPIDTFIKIFPNTFYELKSPPPISEPNQKFFISNHKMAQRKDGSFEFVWCAIFEDGKLIKLYYTKG